MAKSTSKSNAKKEPNSYRSSIRKMAFYDKYMLTAVEASVYFHIGDKKMYDLIREYDGAKWMVRVGSRTMIKRDLFARWLDSQSEL